MSLDDDDDDDDDDRWRILRESKSSVSTRKSRWGSNSCSNSRGKSWVFIGIYDGFNGLDATDYLLYKNVYNELKGLLWNDNPKLTTNSSKNSNKNDEFE